MITAEEAKKESNAYNDQILIDEAPKLIKRVCEEIDNACKNGQYKCRVLYDDFHSIVYENVMCQLRAGGYVVDNIVPYKQLLISWM